MRAIFRGAGRRATRSPANSKIASVGRMACALCFLALPLINHKVATCVRVVTAASKPLISLPFFFSWRYLLITLLSSTCVSACAPYPNYIICMCSVKQLYFSLCPSLRPDAAGLSRLQVLVQERSGDYQYLRPPDAASQAGESLQCQEETIRAVPGPLQGACDERHGRISAAARERPTL